MKKCLCLLILFAVPNITNAGEFYIDNNKNILSDKKNTSEINNMIEYQGQEKYSYNEPEDNISDEGYLKTEFDFNVKKSKMTVGLKGFSVHIPL